MFKTTEPTGVTTYKYDEVDQLIESTGPTWTFLYNYDDNGNRIEQTINGVVSFFAVDAADQLCHQATTQVACGSALAGSTAIKRVSPALANRAVILGYSMKASEFIRQEAEFRRNQPIWAEVGIEDQRSPFKSLDKRFDSETVNSFQAALSAGGS